MKKLYGYFLKGLLAFLPLAITLSLALWFLNTSDRFVSAIINKLGIPPQAPIFNFVLILVFILLLGLLLSSKHFKAMFEWIQGPLKTIPLLKSVYGALEDLMFYFSQNGGKGSPQMAVIVSLPGMGMECVGLVTREDLRDLTREKPAFDGNTVAVYIPMSYMLGGLTVFVPRDRIRALNLPVEEVMKSALTAWIKRPEEPKERD